MKEVLIILLLLLVGCGNNTELLCEVDERHQITDRIEFHPRIISDLTTCTFEVDNSSKLNLEGDVCYNHRFDYVCHLNCKDMVLNEWVNCEEV